MRAILSKAVAGSMIASAALLVSACKSQTNTTANVTETNYAESEVNTTSDDMTSVDAANSTGGNMAADTNSMSGAPVGNNPALHAHSCDGLIATWEDGPRVLPDDSSHRLGRLDSAGALSAALHTEWTALALDDALCPSSPFADCAPIARSAPLASSLQRWDC